MPSTNALVSPPTLDDLPATPDRADRATFAVRCTALFDQLKNTTLAQWRSAMVWMNAAAADAAASAANALGSALQSAASAQSAAQSLAAAQAVSGATRWVPGAFAPGAVVWSPINGQNYRARAALANSVIDPANDSANWFALLLLQALPIVSITAAGTVQASVGMHYVIVAAGVNLVFPPNPSPGDLIAVTNASAVLSNTLDPNGRSFKGDASVMALNDPTASATLKFTTAQGWIKQ